MDIFYILLQYSSHLISTIHNSLLIRLHSIPGHLATISIESYSEAVGRIKDGLLLSERALD